MNGTNQTRLSIAGLLALVTLLICRSVAASPSPAGPPGLYDPDPNHIWNRLHRALFVRTAMGDGREYGFDELDPLLWAGTKHLLEGPSHAEAIKLLDEFLEKHAENQISDPLKRAILQRDLWAVFDWSAAGDSYPLQRRTLQRKLAQVIQRVALREDQIAALPDNYLAAVQSNTYPAAYDPQNRSAPSLPPQLFERNGPWVNVGDNGGGPIAPQHVEAFRGHSVFLVFMRLPQERQATITYLDHLREFAHPWLLSTNYPGKDPFPVVPNPDLPQFPVSTQVALVRQAVLVDNAGKLVPTHLTESVQLRTYRTVPALDAVEFHGRASSSQDADEFVLSRRKLFAENSGGLRAIAPDERDFPSAQFFSLPSDPFELSAEERERFHAGDPQRVVLQTCLGCHSIGPGILSVFSYSRMRFGEPPARPVAPIDESVDRQQQVTIAWKQRQYDWGLLQGIWSDKTD